MELRVIKYFLAVADAGSITEGARQVHVAQPSVSRQLRALERELQVDLFQRGHGPLSLTHAGRKFREVARDLVRREEGAREFIREDKTQVSLQIVAPFATIMLSVAPFTAAHGLEHPVVDAMECDPVSVFERTLAVSADFGISTVAPPADWASRRLTTFGLYVHVPEGHPLGEQPEVQVAELVRHPLLLMDRSNYARLVFDSAVAAEGLEVLSAVELSSSFLALAHAAAGRGVAVVSDQPAFGLRAVPLVAADGPLRLTLYAGWDDSHYASDLITGWLDAYTAWLDADPYFANV